MLCTRCQKRDAKILYTEIINGAKKEQHLCEKCATDYTSFQMEKPLLKSDITLTDLLSTLLESYLNNSGKGQAFETPQILCKNCNTSYETFLQQGRFGCSECYRSYHEELGKTIRGIQGAEQHVGKRPKGFVSSTEKIMMDISEVDKLALKLQESIEKEEFEEAARLRDLIRSLKEETKNA